MKIKQIGTLTAISLTSLMWVNGRVLDENRWHRDLEPAARQVIKDEDTERILCYTEVRYVLCDSIARNKEDSLLQKFKDGGEFDIIRNLSIASLIQDLGNNYDKLEENVRYIYAWFIREELNKPRELPNIKGSYSRILKCVQKAKEWANKQSGDVSLKSSFQSLPDDDIAKFIVQLLKGTETWNSDVGESFGKPEEQFSKQGNSETPKQQANPFEEPNVASTPSPAIINSFCKSHPLKDVLEKKDTRISFLNTLGMFLKNKGVKACDDKQNVPNLKDFFEKNRLTAVCTRGDGNCLFYSFLKSYLIEFSKQSPKENVIYSPEKNDYLDAYFAHQIFNFRKEFAQGITEKDSEKLKEEVMVENGWCNWKVLCELAKKFNKKIILFSALAGDVLIRLILPDGQAVFPDLDGPAIPTAVKLDNQKFYEENSKDALLICYDGENHYMAVRNLRDSE